MRKLTKLTTMIRGKKTYLVAGAMLLYAAGGAATGMLPPGEALRVVLEGFGMAATRAGIAKAGDSREEPL